MDNVCRIYDLGSREVINLQDGARLGYVGDVEVDIETGTVRAIVIPGKLRLFGLLGREEDKIIPWSAIEKIGKDILLVRSGIGGRRLRSLEPTVKLREQKSQSDE